MTNEAIVIRIAEKIESLQKELTTVEKSWYLNKATVFSVDTIQQRLALKDTIVELERIQNYLGKDEDVDPREIAERCTKTFVQYMRRLANGVSNSRGNVFEGENFVKVWKELHNFFFRYHSQTKQSVLEEMDLGVQY